MALTVRATNDDDPYRVVVERFIAQEFPANLGNAEQVLDALTDAFVATAQTRLGPAPKAEGQVEIRRIIRYWMDKNEPIAVLSPWGSKKTVNNHSVDIAELMALRQLQALDERVRRFYAPGTKINIGIEDLGGFYLWANEGEETLRASMRYVHDFVQLVRALDLNFIVAQPESGLVKAHNFNARADLFYDLLRTRVPIATGLGASVAMNSIEGRALTELGWKGDISPEMVQFYLAQYTRLYPEKDVAWRLDKIARYLAQSAARYSVGAKLAFPEWDTNYVQVNFTQPIPGMPASMADKRLFYRTIPLRFAKTHLPPWRAKGYLVIPEGDGPAIPKLANWHDKLPELIKTCPVVIDNGYASAKLEADYVLDGGRSL